MRKYLNWKLFLTIIVIIAALLRIWRIERVPPSLYWDEVSQGYNSYSILKTGYDEHHEFLPIARFKAFGDYKAPVYIYLDVPFIALFGKTILAVRFPSLLLGTLTVLLTYFLASELFYKSENKKKLGLLAAFFLAISPWHIQLSRAAYEANIATFFTVLAAYLFLLTLRTRRSIFLLSTVSFVLAFYSFNAHRIFIPLLVIFLGIIHFKELQSVKKYISIFVIAGLVLLLPFILYLRTPESKLRFNEVNIFTDINIIKQSNEKIAQDNNSVVSRMLHNRRVLYSLSYLKHYFDFFNPNYLFFTGDGNPRFSTQDNGQLYLWSLPLLLAGFYALLKNRTKASFIILGWFLLAPVAAATARETPHALRSETFIPTYEMIGAFGIVYLSALLKKMSGLLYKIFMVLFISLCIFTLVAFLHNYFIHYPNKYYGEWQYGYKEVVEKVEEIKKNYDLIAFTKNYGRPYIYVLFYSDIIPSAYWKESKVVSDQYGFYDVKSVGKYDFRDTLVLDGDKQKKVLYVGSPNEIPKTLKILDTVSGLAGNTIFIVAENN